MNLEEKMKYFEELSTPKNFLPLLPIIVRLDGQNFSKFCKDLEKPFCAEFRSLMTETTLSLMERTSAKFGYTQSDEISLILYSDTYESSIYFHGRYEKIISSLASYCSVYFKEAMKRFLPQKQNELPTFDCRAFSVPTLSEACNYIRQREIDCERNSVSMLARSHFSAGRLFEKTTAEIRTMLLEEKEINWDNLENRFKYGVLMQKRKIKQKFSADEIEKLPEKHNARKDPNLEIERTEIRNLNLKIPKFELIKNKIAVVFYEQEPILY